MSNNLAIAALAQNQASPEVVINDGFGKFDAALTETYAVDLTSGNVDLTAAQYRSAIRFVASGVATSGRTATLEAVKRLILFESAIANSHDISVIVGSTTVTFTPGECALIYTDGTTNGLVKYAFDASGGGTPDPLIKTFDLFFGGVTGDNELLFSAKCQNLPYDLPSALTDGNFVAGVAATASTTLTLKKNGSSIGTLVWAIAGTSATVTFSSSVSFADNDVFSIHGPATHDATLADISLNFSGTYT